MTYANIEDKVFQLAMTVCDKSPDSLKKEKRMLMEETIHITDNIKVEQSISDTHWIVVKNKRFQTNEAFYKKIDEIYDFRYRGDVEKYQKALDIIENEIEAYNDIPTLKM